MQSGYTALLIGRFQSFHIGHLNNLSEILENYNVNNIKIIVVRKENSKLDSNPIPLDVTIDNISKGLDIIYGENIILRYMELTIKILLIFLLKLEILLIIINTKQIM